MAAAGPHLLGAKACNADLYAHARVAQHAAPGHRVAHVAALAAHVKMRPTWKRLYELQGLTEWA